LIEQSVELSFLFHNS